MQRTDNNKKTIIILLAIAIACVIGLVAFILISSAAKEVPDFTGMTLMEAELAGQEADLIVRDGQTEDSEEVEAGAIISQYPVAGMKVHAGDVIIVTASRGLGDGRTPNVTGMSINDAKKKIEKEGFEVGSIEEIAGVEDSGTVKSQDPGGDKELEKGSKINIKVSDGTMTTVPNIRGLYYSDAFRALEKASLTSMSHAHDEVYSSKVKRDNVVSQSVAPGTVVKKGTYVSFVISMGPEPDEDDWDDE